MSEFMRHDKAQTVSEIDPELRVQVEAVIVCDLVEEDNAPGLVFSRQVPYIVSSAFVLKTLEP